MLNQKGFSIAQVSVAMAMMSIMSVGLSTMIQNQANTVYYLEDKMSHQNFKKEIENLLMDTTVCTESLEDIPIPRALVQARPNSGTDFVIKDSTGTTIYNPANNNKNKFDNLKITNIKVQNMDVTDPAVGGKALLKIDVARERGATKQVLKSITIEKNVALDANYKVVSCSGGSDSGGWGECLENDGGTYLGRAGFSGPIRTQANVPSSAKAIKIYIPGDTCEGGSSANDNDWNGSVAAAEIIIPLNGKVIQNGQALTAGGIASLGGRLQNEVFYRGVKLAEVSRCSQSSSSHRTFIPSSNLPFCHKTTDYRGPASGNRLFGNTPVMISFWE